MNHRGSIYFGLLMVVFMSSMLIIGTSISIHQVNQKRIFHSGLAWKALWYGKRTLNLWEAGLAPSEVPVADLLMEDHESPLMDGLMTNKIEISWREESQLKKIVLYGYKQGSP